MKYLKLTQYLYLLAAAFFFYKALTTWNENADTKWLYVIIGVMSVVMFFVRRKFSNQFNGQAKK